MLSPLAGDTYRLEICGSRMMTYSRLPFGHHSLVTPIDWKSLGLSLTSDAIASSHHSLVTPIDWKREKISPNPIKIENRSPLAGDTY